MICAKCGGELLGDRQAAIDLASCGYIGSRFRCTAGCTDRWIKERAPVPVIVLALEPETRGRYAHDERTVVCQACGIDFQTRGSNTKYHAACRAELRRAAWRAWSQAKRAASAA